MNKTFKLAVLLFAISIMLIVTGCNQDKASERSKDELIIAADGEPDTGFDPIKGWGNHTGSQLFQSTLLKRDHTMEIISDLATRYEISDDALTWTLHLRDDVVFSDEKKLTAEDVVFTYKTIQENASVFDLSNVKDIHATDETTVKFVLHSPQSTFINILTQIGIVPKHAYSDSYGEHPIGSGPFQFVQWDKGQQLIVEPNPHYYGKQSDFNKITILYLSEEAAFAAAKSGKVDVAATSPSLANKEIKGMKLHRFTTVDNRGIAFPYVPAGELTTAEGYPVGNDVTSDIAIRKAINIAIDREALVDGLLEGYGTPAYTVNDHMPWWNPESVIEDGDMDQAKQILADAGWQMNSDGILEKDGLEARFTLIYPTDNRDRQLLSIAVSDFVKPLGIDIKVEGKSWDEIGKLMFSNATLMGWGAHNPLEMYNIYSSSTRGFDFFNINYYANETVDQYLDEAMASTNEEEANRLWKLAQWDGTTGLSAKGDAPWAWLLNRDHLYFIRDGLDIGEQKVHSHGHDAQIAENLEYWKWID